MPLAVWGLACGDPAAERQRYAALLRDRRPPEEVIADCNALRDDTLAGDCGMAAVMRARRGRGAASGELCEEVREGIWNHECWFLAAETAARRGDPKTAGAYCGRTGPFMDDCAQHLWQGDVRELIHPHGPAGFAKTLPRAAAIHARWAATLGDTDALRQRFWARYFANGFEGARGVDLSYCDALEEPESRERCVAAGEEVFGRELRPALDVRGRALCGDPAPTVADLGPPNRPDPRLDAVIDRVRARYCR